MRQTDAAGQVSFTLESPTFSFSAHHPDWRATFSGPAPVRADAPVELKLSSEPGTAVEVSLQGLTAASGDGRTEITRLSNDTGDIFAMSLSAGLDLIVHHQKTTRARSVLWNTPLQPLLRKD